MQISIKTVEAQITKALKLIKNFLDEKYIYLFKKNSFLNKGYFILMCHTVVKS